MQAVTRSVSRQPTLMCLCVLLSLVSPAVGRSSRSNWLPAGRSRGIPVGGGGEIFCTRPNLPWGHSASYTMGAGSLPVAKRPGRGFDHPPLCNAEIKELCYTSTPPLVFVACYRVNCTFTFTIVSPTTLSFSRAVSLTYC